MKVDVIQASDIKFKRWQWWSDWIDICVFNHEYCGHILQMSVSRSNRKKFKTSSFRKSGVSMIRTTTVSVGDLTQMSGGDNNA